MQESLKQFKANIISNIPGLIAVSIVEIETGISYMSYTTSPDFDADIAAPFNLDVLKAHTTTMQALGLTENVNNIIASINSQTHIIDTDEKFSYFIYMVVDPESNNLAMTRHLLNKYKAELEIN